MAYAEIDHCGASSDGESYPLTFAVPESAPDDPDADRNESEKHQERV